MRTTDLLNYARGVRRISSGPAAGLRIVPLDADRAIARGTYEAPVQRALLDAVAPGQVVYDIGANVGFFTLLAARQVGATGRVYAFEPVPRNAAAIRRSVRLNGAANVEVLEFAVAARSGVAELNLARHIGGAVLAEVGAPPDREGSVRVDVVALDDIVPAWDLRPPHVVKIDVEGAEIEALLGMRATLAEHGPVLIVEIDDATRAGLHRKQAELVALLGELRYEMFELAAAYAHVGWEVAHFVARPRC